ncbi:asparaginase [Atopobiaceae bacterium LCP21S3_F11]
MKKILMVATGGTIASTQAGSGLAPTLTGHELAAMVPGIDGLCELDVCQPMNIDSTNMRPRNWLAVRDTIVDAYDDYDGFVVLHGTDTMAYTAAALSYLIQGSPKPIVLTGSQQPMANPFTDAKLNLYQSLLYALDDASRDVCVVFGGDVICGTRARKQRTMSFNAFTSMNMPPLACIRNNRIVRPATLPVAHALPAQGDARAASAQPRLFDTLDERVIVIRLTPELGPSVLDLLARDYDAVVLETFGIGGIPDYGGGWHAAISRWVESGRIVVVTTQVPEEGLDLGVYEVGRAYANMGGVLAAGDMTVEAIVAKTMWALGQTRDQARVAELFAHPVNNDRTA